MAYHQTSGPIRPAFLVVACAILGLLLDVAPTSIRGLAPSVQVASDDATPTVPPSEDKEGDEAPDDLNDLACPVRTRGALGGLTDRSAPIGATVRPVVASVRPRLVVLPTSLDLPITLCRLTC